MEMESNIGPLVLFIKEIFVMTKKMDMGFFSGKTGQNTVESCWITNFMVKEPMSGRMVENMKVFSKITKCMEMVFFLGPMDKYIKETTKMILNMGKEKLSGKMALFLMEILLKAKKKEKE